MDQKRRLARLSRICSKLKRDNQKEIDKLDIEIAGIDDALEKVQSADFLTLSEGLEIINAIPGVK